MAIYPSEPTSHSLGEGDRRELHTLARKIARGDMSLADDIEQETLAAALQADSGAIVSISKWMSSVARNVFRLHLRKKASGPRFVLLPGEVVSEQEIDPSEICSQQEIATILASRLSELPEHYRTVIQLGVIDGHPPREVGRLLGIPVETARTRLRRGLDRLRETVSIDLDIDGDRPAHPTLGLLGFLRMALIPAAATLGIVTVYAWLNSSPAPDVESTLVAADAAALVQGPLQALAHVETDHSRSPVAAPAKLARVAVELVPSGEDGSSLNALNVDLQGPDGAGQVLAFDASLPTQMAELVPGNWTAWIDGEAVSVREIGEEELTWRIVVPQGAGLEISVVKADGQPYAGAEVHSQDGLWGRSTLLGITDKLGMYRLAPSAGDEWIGVMTSKGSYSESVHVPTLGSKRKLQLSVTKRRTQWLDLALPLDLTSAAHQVRSLDLRASLRTTLDSERGMTGPSDWIRASRDALGRFRLRVGTHRVIEVIDGEGKIVALGSTSGRMNGGTPEDEGTAVFEYFGLSGVRGRLIDAEAQPMPGVDLTLSPRDFQGRDYFSATTDATGHFTFEDVPAFRWALKSRSELLHSFVTDGEAADYDLGEISTIRCGLRVVITGSGRPTNVTFKSKAFKRSAPHLHLLGMGAAKEVIEAQGGTGIGIEQPSRLTIPALWFESKNANGRAPLMKLVIRPPDRWSEASLQVDLRSAEAAQLVGHVAEDLLPAKAVAYNVQTNWPQALELDPVTGELIEAFLPAGDWCVAILDKNGEFHDFKAASSLQPSQIVDLGSLGKPAQTVRIQWPPGWVGASSRGRILVRSIQTTVSFSQSYPSSLLEQPWFECELPTGRHFLQLVRGKRSAFAEVNVRGGEAQMVQASDSMLVTLALSKSNWTGGDTLRFVVRDPSGKLLEEALFPVRRMQSFVHFAGTMTRVEEGTIEILDPSLDEPLLFDIIPGRAVQNLSSIRRAELDEGDREIVAPRD